MAEVRWMVGDDPLLPCCSLSQTVLESHTVGGRSLPFVIYPLIECPGRMDEGGNWENILAELGILMAGARL